MTVKPGDPDYDYTCQVCGDMWPVRVLAKECNHKRMQRKWATQQATSVNSRRVLPHLGGT